MDIRETRTVSSRKSWQARIDLRSLLGYHPLAVGVDPVGGNHAAHHVVAGPAVHLVWRRHHGQVATVAGDGDAVGAASAKDLGAPGQAATGRLYPVAASATPLAMIIAATTATHTRATLRAKLPPHYLFPDDANIPLPHQMHIDRLDDPHRPQV